MRTHLNRTLAAATAVAALALTGACSGGADTTSSDEARSYSESGSAGGNAAPGSATNRDGITVGEAAPAADQTLVQVRSVIKTGEIALTVKDVDDARSEVEGLLVSVGGTIDSERTTHDRDGDLKRATLLLRVPVDEFEAAMSGLQELGKVKHYNTSASDVTTEVIDVDERVETLQNSLNRLQAYQAAAKDLDDLIRFEQQITQRESELQSLKAQQAYLEDQTSMSTISVYLSTPKAYVEPPSALDDAGFLAGLKSGWNALTSAVVVVLTVLGAILPFAGVALLVGIPVWLLVRRTLRSHAAARPIPETPSAPPSA